MSAFHMPDLHRFAADHRVRLWTTGVVVFAFVLLATSLVAVWLLPEPAATAVMPEPQLFAGAKRSPKFIRYASPHTIANVEFEDGKGQKRTLADFRGKVVLLNLWATWCGPCREEMPTLDRLQSRLGGSDFEVVALSIDRGGQVLVKSFFDEIDVQRLAVYVDPTAEAGTKLAILGVPTTLLLDREGNEMGRLTGAAEWDSPEVMNTIRLYLR